MSWALGQIMLAGEAPTTPLQGPAPAPLQSFENLAGRYDAQRDALAEAVATASQKRQIVQRLEARATAARVDSEREKARTLVETKAIAALLQQQRDAENRMVAAALKELGVELPQFREQSLRAARQKALGEAGQPVDDWIGLPALKDGQPMTYAQHMAPDTDLLLAKIAAPVNLDAPALSAAQLADREVSKQLALRKVVDFSNAVRARQPDTTVKTREQRLADLVNEYLADKITARDYYQKRQQILSEP